MASNHTTIKNHAGIPSRKIDISINFPEKTQQLQQGPTLPRIVGPTIEYIISNEINEVPRNGTPWDQKNPREINAVPQTPYPWDHAKHPLTSLSRTDGINAFLSH